ncbi:MULTISPECIES: VanW family protein [Bacillus]|uniref:VanW family protein n=1 Tax=Bacillus TaxID=1386 RepID=UPI00032EB9C6|nr:VanW family protein [Bacillus wiedmannii]EOQ17283.1 vancomycin B-type resistance protein VanW [Bacillus cereus B5-2]EOQ34664.1 vancomycin B-type resistance protein VanW [Bacillus cereus BAG3O-1]MBJ8118410.1 VanW family protein [Bacillus cereus]PFW82465.1 vancomycin resistance protein [Bacillus sp. AFS075960]RFB10096.1 vancomycin resistance protein [Bacillus sp. OE]RFB21697.1 vancomycin resistance protein [Bacillus sp. LB(2018)]RFB43140.1 vancomycin resistance protein [Bacillus sp. dmp10]
MKLSKILIGSAIAGGILLCVGGVGGYQYVSTLNNQLDTTALPHTTFEGISLDGKNKTDIQAIINQKITELDQKSLTYIFQNDKQTYTWKDLGMNYKEKDIVDKIFKEQEGNAINRYKMRKQAENGELKRDYKLTPQLNTTAYESFMKDKYNETLKNPVNAELSVEGSTVNISQSQNGEKIDKGKLTDLTKQAITSGTSDVTLPVTLLKPERSTEDIQKMGIKEVIAEYSTPMAGRNGNQSFNVNKSANTLSGVIVAPDETFSFNGRVGVTDAAHGYKSAAVYSQGKVIQSAGGGVCQVSSTLYSAALRADLGIVSRSNHSMPVNYLPLGQDAAVADYGPDLKFKNNTGNHIYIQAFSNGGSITTRIFGTNTGKNVEVSSQVISRTNDKITAVTYKKVTQNGEVVSNGQISKSVYKSAPTQ